MLGGGGCGKKRKREKGRSQGGNVRTNGDWRRGATKRERKKIRGREDHSFKCAMRQKKVRGEKEGQKEVVKRGVVRKSSWGKAVVVEMWTKEAGGKGGGGGKGRRC